MKLLTIQCATVASLILTACAQPDHCETGAECDNSKADEIDGNSPAAAQGSWSGPSTAPLHFLHGALLHTGKVILYSGYQSFGFDLQYASYDPLQDDFSLFDMPGDLLCSHHASLPDGNLLIMGGGGQSLGNRKTWSFVLDATTETLGDDSPMQTARWYPTSLPLSDGRVLVASGLRSVAPLEIYDPNTNGWSILNNADRQWPQLYPGLHMLPSGRVFNSTVGWNTSSPTHQVSSAILTLDSAGGTWADAPSMEFTDRREGTAVTWVDDTGTQPAMKVMVIGGGRADSRQPTNAARPNSAEIASVDASETITWTRTPDMAHPRTNVNSVILPNGKVLVIGGRRGDKWRAPTQDAVHETELYDPTTNRWTTMAPAQLVHQYHTVAMVLPDGRVLVGGGVDPTKGSGQTVLHRRDYEIFSPPYLFANGRPEITRAPDTIRYGQEFTVEVSNAASIKAVSLLSPSSVTHHTDAGGRYVQLAITARNATSVTVRAPTSGGVMPPGQHMLIAVDEGDIPSAARFLRVAQ